MATNISRGTEDDVRQVLLRFLADADAAPDMVDNDLVALLSSSIDRATETAYEPVQEIVGGNDPSKMSLIYIRHGRRTAKSIDFKNFTADATTATNAMLVTLTGTPAIATMLSSGSVGATFLPFVVGVTFTFWKSFEKTIGWPEACLFFALHEEANFHDFVSDQVVSGMGPILKNRFGYAKAMNSNEMDDLLDKLVAHGALRRDVNGYRLMEGVRRSWIDWYN